MDVMLEVSMAILSWQGNKQEDQGLHAKASPKDRKGPGLCQYYWVILSTLECQPMDFFPICLAIASCFSVIYCQRDS